jgi:hypothetical protein
MFIYGFCFFLYILKADNIQKKESSEKAFLSLQIANPKIHQRIYTVAE